MAAERLSMRKTKEILRQRWALSRSYREIAKSLGVSVGAVGNTLHRAEASGLSWDTVETLNEDELEQRVYGERATPGAQRPMPDCSHIRAERSKPGVTLELLHLEYLAKHPNGYLYTQFTTVYREWLRRQKLSMRQVHNAGDKVFVDYAGKKPRIQDPTTGEVCEVELFVAVLGASNFTYAEVTRSQRGRDWISSHIRMLEFFGGSTRAIVCDQLKSGVSSSCRYEPGVQRTYEEMAAHYGTTVLPARPAHPRDKAKVEVGVQVVERWILARLRNETFFSLHAMNTRIAELLQDLNNRTMKTYGASRRELFDRIERSTLRPLPPQAFQYGEWKLATVNVDYHVEVDHHYYSVPHSFAHERVDVRVSASVVEVFLRGRRIASHPRSEERGRHTTQTEHMPKAHQKHLEWTPSRFCRWAGTIGPQTEALVSRILEERPHPEQGYRSCLGILRLARVYSPSRLEAACARAIEGNARSYRSVESILKHGLDRNRREEADSTTKTMTHENIRGNNYYN